MTDSSTPNNDSADSTVPQAPAVETSADLWRAPHVRDVQETQSLPFGDPGTPPPANDTLILPAYTGLPASAGLSEPTVVAAPTYAAPPEPPAPHRSASVAAGWEQTATPAFGTAPGYQPTSGYPSTPGYQQPLDYGRPTYTAHDTGASYAPTGYPAAPQAFSGGANVPPPSDPFAVPAASASAPAPRRARSIIPVALAAGLLAGALGGVASYGISERANGNAVAASSLSPVPQTQNASAQLSSRPEGSIAQVAAKVLPTVVSISVNGASGVGTGSGFVIRKDGYILTNNHVVASAARGGNISVTFSDGSDADAKIVGRDTSYDLAVLKVELDGLATSTLGNSDNVVVGDSSIAIGSPLGLSGTVTAGIVSALNRPVTAGGSLTTDPTSFISAIQTDAAINPGNSGGPLVDATGAVIGVNSAIATLGRSAGSQSGSIGLGFAIPINQAQRIAEELIKNGVATYPVLGVSLSAENRTGQSGAEIGDVESGGPADQAGIKQGDIVLEVDGTKVADGTELIVRVRENVPGDKVTLTLKEGSGTRDVEVTLGSRTATNS